MYDKISYDEAVSVIPQIIKRHLFWQSILDKTEHDWDMQQRKIFWNRAWKIGIILVLKVYEDM